MKKMTVRKMLENIVVKTAGLDVKKFYLVSTDGEVVTADFAVDLICKVATWNVLWEVEIVAAKHYEDVVTVIYNPDVEQTNGDPDKNLTPYIYERHVFDCKKRYGELCPPAGKGTGRTGL